MATNEQRDLVRSFREGRISRREFLARALALGVSASVVGGAVSAAAGTSTTEAATPDGTPRLGPEGRRHRVAENIVFPADSGVINVKEPPYNAKGDGVTDDTAAIQAALSEYPNGRRIIYLPNGTYLVSDQLRWPAGHGNGDEYKNTILQGQSEAGAVIKLKDGSLGFDDPSSPKGVIWTGPRPAQRFRNAVRTLTVDTGEDNPGAAGIQFDANNEGCVRDVTIRGRGVIGLDMSYTDEIGPLLVKNLTVDGFQYGIKCGYTVDSQTFEHITLRNQGRYGFYNDGQAVSIRDLHSTNSVIAVYNANSLGHLVVIDSTLKGIGTAKGLPAIKNEAVLFARNIKTPGYKRAIEDNSGGKGHAVGPPPNRARHVVEYVSSPVLSLFPTPQRSLDLPVRETPELPWDDLSEWANVVDYGAKPNSSEDSGVGIQAAIDSGKTTVYFPNAGYTINQTVYIRGKVRRIIGTEAYIGVSANIPVGFRMVDGEGYAPVVVFERFESGYTTTPTIENASGRTLVMRDCSNVSGKMTGPGDIFLEDVVSNPFQHWEFNHQRVWARQFNVENQGTHVYNNGGTLWILGMKTERGGTLIDTRGYGKTELLGTFCYTTTDPGTAPMFINEDSSVSFSFQEASYGGTPYNTIVQETRDGETRTLNRGETPIVKGGSDLPLYVGYRRHAPKPTFTRVEAESYTEATNNAGGNIYKTDSYIGGLDVGDWVKYANVDLGDGINTFLVNLAVPGDYAGKQVELRVDSATGPVVATLTTQSTGGWEGFDIQSVPTISRITGVHDVYLTFAGAPGGVANIDWFGFYGPASTVLVPPSNLTATENHGQVGLSWAASPDAASYNVKRSTTDGRGYTTIASRVAGTSYTDTIPTDHTTYYYVVTAVSAQGAESGYSNQVAATGGGLPEVHVPPTRIKIQAESYTEAVDNAGGNIYKTDSYIGGLDVGDWVKYANVDLGTGIVAFRANLAVPDPFAGQTIEVRLDSVTGPVIASLTTTATPDWSSYTIQSTSVAGNPTGVHDIFLTFSGRGNGGVANIDWLGFADNSAPPPTASAPTDLKAVAGNGLVRLSWTGSQGANSYDVKRSADGTGYETIGNTTDTSYTDTSVRNGSTYYYVVTAVNDGGESVSSNQAVAMPVAGL